MCLTLTMVALYSMQSLWLCFLLVHSVSSPSTLNMRSWISLLQSIAQNFFFFWLFLWFCLRGFESFYCKICFVHVYISAFAFWQMVPHGLVLWYNVGFMVYPVMPNWQAPRQKVTQNQKSFLQHTLQLLRRSFYQKAILIWRHV